MAPKLTLVRRLQRPMLVLNQKQPLTGPGPAEHRCPSLSLRPVVHRNTSFRSLSKTVFTKKFEELASSYHARGKGLPATVGHAGPGSQSEAVAKF